MLSCLQVPADIKEGFKSIRLEAFLLFCLCWNYRNLLFVSAFPLETNNTVYQCKQRIIAAASHIHTRMNSGSALSVEDIAGLYKLTVCSFGSKSL